MILGVVGPIMGALLIIGGVILCFIFLAVDISNFKAEAESLRKQLDKENQKLNS